MRWFTIFSLRYALLNRRPTSADFRASHSFRTLQKLAIITVITLTWRLYVIQITVR